MLHHFRGVCVCLCARVCVCVHCMATVSPSGRAWNNIVFTNFHVLVTLCPFKDALLLIRCFFPLWIPFTHKEALDISILFLHGNIMTLFCSGYYGRFFSCHFSFIVSDCCLFVPLYTIVLCISGTKPSIRKTPSRPL